MILYNKLILIIHIIFTVSHYKLFFDVAINDQGLALQTDRQTCGAAAQIESRARYVSNFPFRLQLKKGSC